MITKGFESDSLSINRSSLISLSIKISHDSFTNRVIEANRALKSIRGFEFDKKI